MLLVFQTALSTRHPEAFSLNVLRLTLQIKGTSRSPANITGGSTEAVREHTAKKLIVGKAMPFQQIFERSIRFYEVLIDFTQAIFIQILQIGHSGILLKYMAEIIDLQMQLCGYILKRYGLIIMCLRIRRDCGHPLSVSVSGGRMDRFIFGIGKSQIDLVNDFQDQAAAAKAGSRFTAFPEFHDLTEKSPDPIKASLRVRVTCKGIADDPGHVQWPHALGKGIYRDL